MNAHNRIEIVLIFDFNSMHQLLATAMKLASHHLIFYIFFFIPAELAFVWKCTRWSSVCVLSCN